VKKDDEKNSSGGDGEGVPGERPDPPERDSEEGARPGEGQVRPYQQVPRNPLDHGGIDE